LKLLIELAEGLLRPLEALAERLLRLLGEGEGIKHNRFMRSKKQISRIRSHPSQIV
jgi:hypothetical protein